MPGEEVLALEARFKETPDSLSALELEVLYLATRARITEFERRAARNRSGSE